MKERQSEIQRKLTRPLKIPRASIKYQNSIQLPEDFTCKIIGFSQSQIVKSGNLMKDIKWNRNNSPEFILGINHNSKTDIWSLACAIFELYTGDYLFHPQKDLCMNEKKRSLLSNSRVAW